MTSPPLASDPSPAPHPLLLVFRAPALLSVVLAGEALAAILALSPGLDAERWAFFGLMSLLIQWVTLLTLGLLHLARHALVRLSPRLVAWIAVAALLLINGLLGLVGGQLAPWLWPGSDIDWAAVTLQMSAMMGIVGVLMALAFDNHWRSQQLALRAKQAELDVLQARINPHFLFNSLNSAAALAHARPAAAEQVLLDLSDLFRAALSEPGWVPLEDELDLCRRYLAIETARFGDRLQVEWRLPERVTGLWAPRLSIQPLIENAVAHGLDDVSGVKPLRIDISDDGTHLLVAVTNAVPRAPRAPHRGHRVGLAGVRARIASATHGAGQITTERVDEHFIARIMLPHAAMPEADQDAMR